MSHFDSLRQKNGLAGRLSSGRSRTPAGRKAGRRSPHRFRGSLLEGLELRRLLAFTPIAAPSVTTDSTTLATDRSGTYFNSGTTTITGIAPPPNWQQADRATALLGISPFNTGGGTKVLVKVDLSYHTDAVTQFTDSLGASSPFFKPNWSIENTSAAGTGSLTALTPNTQNPEPNGRIMLANAS